MHRRDQLERVTLAKPLDWTAAYCANAKTPKGPCCYCGKPMLCGQGYIAYLDGFRAHYYCAPGLGVPVQDGGEGDG